MKPTTHEWLTRAAEDLTAAQLLLPRPDLTNVVTFHAQQAVEKALKAVIEELDLGFVRTHSLTRLYELVRPHYPVIGDMDMLDRLDAVYIEARYPGDMGLLPTGKPTSDEAANLYGFANDVFQRLHTGLQGKNGIHLAPAELSEEEIENRALRFLLKNVGDAVGIGRLRRTAAGLWLAPVLEAATGRPIGQLCYTAAGDFVSSESTPLEKLLGAGDGS